MNLIQNKLLLREERIVETVERLQRRISDRFPDSSLSAVCGELLDVAEQASERSEWIGNPIRPLRVVGYTTAVALVVSFFMIIVYGFRNSESERIGFFGLVQAVEAGLNDIVFFALAIWFLISIEARIKRRRAIEAVHELRSLAHVIDMHQLTKDPDRVIRGWSGTPNSPTERMTAEELKRYLDYCSEMLSLIGKIASLYVQRFDDSDAVAAVSEVEQLSTGLSRNIWQKIMILNQTRDMRLQLTGDTETEPRKDRSKPVDTTAT